VCRFEFEAEHINFGYAVPTFRSVPDPAQRYAVTVGTSPFTTANVTLNLTDEGILTGASNTYTDKTFETVVGVIGKIAKSIIKEAPPRLDLPDRKDPKVVCEQAKEVRREIERLRRAIEDARAKRRDIVNEIKPGGPDAGALEKKAGWLSELISMYEGQLAQVLEQGETFTRIEQIQRSSFTLGFTQVEPEDFTPYAEKLTGQRVIGSQTKRPTAAEVQEVTKYLADQKIEFGITIQPVASALCGAQYPCTAQNPDETLQGYRYRVPVKAEVRVCVVGQKRFKQMQLSKTLACPLGSVDMLYSGEAIIAQYGPIAALPSRFKGQGGTVNLSASPQSAALTNVTLGSSGLDPATVVNASDAIATAIQERQRRKQQEAEAAKTAAEKAAEAEKTAEKDKLQLEVDTLELRRKKRDLERDLGM